MQIPHKSKQKEGWLYWDFAADQEWYPGIIEIFVKNKAVASIPELIYHDFWKITEELESLEINKNEKLFPLKPIKDVIEKELYLIAHFDLFGFELRLKVEIPPMPFIRIPITVNYLDLNYDITYTQEPAIKTLEYRLSKTSVTDAWYELVSKVSLSIK